MKKFNTANQADKAEIKVDMQARPVSVPKVFRDHKTFDHSHGRVNKPIGINHEPGLF